VKKEKRVLLHSSNEIDDIYNNYYTWYIILTSHYTYNIPLEFKKEIAYHLINSAKVIQ
jgi:hypothetical protein